MIRHSLCLLACLPVMAVAQQELNGKDQFPQFRSLSGLPGGGFGITKDGTPTFRGAFALSTPIAYSLGNNRWSLGVANTSDDLRFRFFERSGEKKNDSNGTAALMGGIGTPVGDFTLGYMVLSSIGDNVFTAPFSSRLKTDKIALGIGLQDVFSRGGDSGEALDNAKKLDRSRSFYVVATAEACEDVYVSLGAGTRRFEGLFGNASFPLVRGFRGMVEYDTFNWNMGVAVDLGSARVGHYWDDRDRRLQSTGFVGLVRGKFLTWGVNLSF